MSLLPVGTRCTVKVPGSTSNLGPGFDAIGCAVAMHNEFEYEILADDAEETVRLSGSRRNGIPAGPDNLALESARMFFRRLGVPAPRMSLRASIEIPSARGLGSSSTAIVAGLSAANEFLDRPMDRAGLLNMAVEIEGHPDNVAPAILGGLVVAALDSDPLAYMQLPVHPEVSFVFVIPDYEVLTSKARAVLPKEVPLRDAVFNASRSPLVVLALQTGHLGVIGQAINDRLHQPWRKHLFPGFDTFREAALAAGAAGFCVSGAGPTMLAICQSPRRREVAEALEATAAGMEFGADVMEILPDNTGTEAILSP